MEASTVSAAEADLLMLRLEAHFFWTPMKQRKGKMAHDDQLELLSTKEPISYQFQKSRSVCIIVLQDLLGRRPELVSSLAPTEKSATFFWMIKKHGSVSTSCLYNLFYMFFAMVLSSFC